MKPLASICKRGLLRAMGPRVNARPRGNPESLRGKILELKPDPRLVTTYDRPLRRIRMGDTYDKSEFR